MKYSLLIFLFLASCKFEEPIALNKSKYFGYVATDYDKGNSFPEFITKNFPKIEIPLNTLTYKDYLFVQDYGKGIHVFQIQGSSSPVQVGFFRIPASTDFSIKNEILTFNSARKLFFMNIEGLNTAILGGTGIKLIKTEIDLIAYPNYPPFKNKAFVCIDSTAGFVTGWKKDSLTKIECFR